MSGSISPGGANIGPPHVRPSDGPRRWWVLALLFFVMAISLLDRQVLSVVAPALRDQFHLSNSAYGTIVALFLLGMSLGQLPAGAFFDRRGGRVGFGCVLSAWSVVNLAHGFATSAWQFGGLRFLLGTSECGVYSGGVKVIGQWFGERERALAAGIFNSGGLVGSVIAPPLIVWLTLQFGWRWAFLLPSIAGLLWLIPWLASYRDPAPAAEERGAARPSIWPLLRHRAVWGVVLMRAFGGPVSQFYWYWMPEYFKHARGMSLAQVGMFTWLPFFAGALGNIGGGWFSSALIRAGWTINGARRLAISVATVLCLCAVATPLVRSVGAALALVSVASLGINAIAANLMGLQADLFQPAVLARVGALTGLGDSSMSMVTTLLTGIVIDRFSYLPVFICAGVFPLITFLALFFVVGRIPSAPRRIAAAGSRS